MHIGLQYTTLLDLKELLPFVWTLTTSFLIICLVSIHPVRPLLPKILLSIESHEWTSHGLTPSVNIPNTCTIQIQILVIKDHIFYKINECSDIINPGIILKLLSNNNTTPGNI